MLRTNAAPRQAERPRKQRTAFSCFLSPHVHVARATCYGEDPGTPDVGDSAPAQADVLPYPRARTPGPRNTPDPIYEAGAGLSSSPCDSGGCRRV